MTREISDIIMRKLAKHYGDVVPDLKYVDVWLSWLRLLRRRRLTCR